MPAAGPPGSGDSSSLVSSPSIRSAETFGGASSPARSAIAARTAGVAVKPSWAVNRAARSIRSGSSVNEASGRAGRPQHFAPQVGQAAERVDQLVAGQPGGHGVDREVAPGQVVFQRACRSDTTGLRDVRS